MGVPSWRGDVMAWMREIIVWCQIAGCPERATVEVFTSGPEPHGKFCKEHGTKEMERLNAFEPPAESKRG